MNNVPVEGWELLARALAGESTGAIIEDQERRGQQIQARRQTLPIKGPQTDMETLGFVFGDPADDLFIAVQFPDGWRKQATDHAMWTDLLDPQGRKRAAIFYKAAFYDRSAFYRLERRYLVTTHFGADLAAESEFYSCDLPTYTIVRDTATGATVWHSDLLPPLDDAAEMPVKRAYWAREEVDRQAAVAWLETNYPDYNNPLAYWD